MRIASASWHAFRVEAGKASPVASIAAPPKGCSSRFKVISGDAALIVSRMRAASPTTSGPTGVAAGLQKAEGCGGKWARTDAVSGKDHDAEATLDQHPFKHISSVFSHLLEDMMRWVQEAKCELCVIADCEFGRTYTRAKSGERVVCRRSWAHRNVHASQINDCLGLRLPAVLLIGLALTSEVARVGRR
jgi:hypothetical protein